MSSVGFDPFAGGELLRVSPTTGPQKEIIGSAQMSDEANTAFNEAVSITIKGDLQVALLETCFNRLVDRHDVLRATFSRNGQEICLQETKPFRLDFEDLSLLTPSDQEKEISNLWRNIAISPMNLEEGPLFFAWVKKLADKHFELIIAAHHIICDGWSIGMLINELVQLYRRSGSAEGMAPADSFFEFAEQLDAKEFSNKDNDYWQEKFLQIPPVLDLPLDNARPLTRTFQACRFDYDLDAELVASLRKAAGSMKASLVNVVLAGYFTLLHRLTGSEDIVVGLPVAGQAVFKRPNLVAHMVQLLPIRLAFGGDTKFAELVGLVKSEVLNASEHPNFTFGKLLEKMTIDRSRMPLVSTIFNIDQPMPPLDFGGSIGTLRTIPRAAENFEMFLNVLPTDKKLTVETTYSTALFSESTVRAWLDSLECILSNAVSNPNTKISDIVLTKSVPEILRQSNATSADIKFPDFVSAFRHQSKLTPEAPALVCSDRTLSYEHLDRHSDAVANVLASKGVKERDVVGLCCERSEKMVICVIALLKLGAAYLPLDPDFPQDRLLYMLEDSGAAAVIEDDAAPQNLRDLSILHFDINGLADAASTDAASQPLADNPDRLAYMIYTSGSTGKPKGVRVPTRAMINFLESMVREPGCRSTDRLLAVTTLSFDISVLELFMPLISGACTVIATREQAKDGAKLVELIAANKITLMQATPSTWRLLLANDWKDQPKVAKLKALCGGEPLPLDLVAELLPCVAELWNMYGPTETTVWSTCKRIFRADELITIGKPIANTQVYILDKNLNALPISAPGEMYIGGTGVTLGYHNRAELSAQRFVSHPTFGRIYATGDLAKILPNGEIQHLGRLDDQVKLRGYRIELGEIESALVNCPGVQAAAVYLWELAPEDVRIVACCVPAVSQRLEINSIRKQLRKTLPNYMVPQYFMEVGSIPLTPNGKVNRRALPRPEETRSSILAKSVLITDAEKVIGKIWEEVVKPKHPVGREDNFFEIGGHSLLALLAIRKIESATGNKITPTEIIAKRLWEIADKVSAEAGKSEATQTGPSALPSAAVRGLSPEQMRILRRQLAHPESTCNNLLGGWILEGDLDLEAFRKSLVRVYERQTALRTVIQPYQDDFRQVLQHVNTIELPEFEDCSTQDVPYEFALGKAIEYVQKPFVLLNSGLSRAKLFRLDSRKYMFTIGIHQLIFDGWSYDIFLGELEAGYRGLTEGTALPASSLPFEFRDYAQWCNTRDLNQQHLDFYRRAIDRGLNFGFSTDSRTKGTCAERVFKLPVTDLEKIEAFCLTHKVRLHEFLFAVFSKAVCEFSGKSAVTLGLPVSGRYAPEVINLVGSFVTVLPCEVRMESDKFSDIAQNVAQTLKVFYENQSVSYAEVVKGTEREKEHFPSALPASFSFQDIRNRPSKLGILGLSQINLPRKQTELPIEYWTRVQPDGITIGFDYDSGLVDLSAIDSLASKIELIVRDALDQKVESAPVSMGQEGQITPQKPLWRNLFSKAAS